MTLTPRGQHSPGLLRLLAAMEMIDPRFNAELHPAGSDVAHLALVGNGEGWEAVAEVDEDRYDIWYNGRIVRTGLTVDQAAICMVARYIEGKWARVRQEGVH
jgi:hypothetical protein